MVCTSLSHSLCSSERLCVSKPGELPKFGKANSSYLSRGKSESVLRGAGLCESRGGREAGHFLTGVAGACRQEPEQQPEWSSSLRLTQPQNGWKGKTSQKLDLPLLTDARAKEMSMRHVNCALKITAPTLHSYHVPRNKHPLVFLFLNLSQEPFVYLCSDLSSPSFPRYLL